MVGRYPTPVSPCCVQNAENPGTKWDKNSMQFLPKHYVQLHNTELWVQNEKYVYKSIWKILKHTSNYLPCYSKRLHYNHGWRYWTHQQNRIKLPVVMNTISTICLKKQALFQNWGRYRKGMWHVGIRGEIL